MNYLKTVKESFSKFHSKALTIDYYHTLQRQNKFVLLLLQSKMYNRVCCIKIFYKSVILRYDLQFQPYFGFTT